MFKNINRNKILVSLLALLVIVLAIILVITQLKNRTETAKNNHYSVVYLATGEIYVGELSTFPRMELKNGYFITSEKDPADPTKVTPKLSSLGDVLWAPKHLFLNKDQVVFYGPLLDTSKIAQTLAGQIK
jgi:hypothetical protein